LVFGLLLTKHERQQCERKNGVERQPAFEDGGASGVAALRGKVAIMLLQVIWHVFGLFAAVFRMRARLCEAESLRV